MDQTTKERRSWLRWVLAVLILGAIAAFYGSGASRYFSWDYVREHREVLTASVREHLLAGVVLFFLVYVTVTALSLPAAGILSLLAGALFDRWLGTAVVSLAATLGATLAFLSSRYLFRDWVQQRFADRLRALNKGVQQNGALYLFTLRLVVVMPFFLINLGMGLTPMRLRTFSAVSFVGMLPGTFLYVNAGRALAEIDSPRDVLSPGVLISLALLGLAPLLFRKLIWRHRDWRTPDT